MKWKPVANAVRHLLFHLTALVSMLLLLALIFGWVRGYWKGQQISRGGQKSALYIVVESGEIWLAATNFGGNVGWTYEQRPSTPKTLPQWLDVLKRMAIPGWHAAVWHRFGVSVAHINYSETMASRIVAIPIWWLIPLTVPMPLLWIRDQLRRRNQRRRDDRWRRGFCPNCGYDLRAASATCPECGQPIPPRSACAEPSRRHRT